MKFLFLYNKTTHNENTNPYTNLYNFLKNTSDLGRNRFKYGQKISISKSTINSILIFKVLVFIKNRHRDGIYFLQFLTFYFFMEFEFLPINKMWFCTLWFRTKMLWIFHFFSLVRLWKVVLLLIGYIFEFRGAVYRKWNMMVCSC